MMKVKNKTKYIFYILFWIYILSIFENIHCKDIDAQKTNRINDLFLSSISPNQSDTCDNDNTANFFLNNGIKSREIKRTINVGEVQTEILNNKKRYLFNFLKLNVTNDILVHFYSIDCPIDIYANDENINIEKIKYYEYDAFFVVIDKNKLDSTIFEVQPIMSSYSDYNKNKENHLIINSFEKDKDYSEILLKEKAPTFLFFNEKLTKIKISFILEGKIEETMYFSFFIKERAKFSVEVESKEYNGLIKNKNISYIDNIIITPDQLKSISKYPHKISFLINKESKEIQNATMIIKVVSNYSSPFYIQKNFINLGFMPNKENQQNKQFFYLEVFQKEEGDILLNNKRCNGKLISKIINKKEIDNIEQHFPNDISPDGMGVLEYYDYSQKIIFNAKDTRTCEEGCYIVIEYISEPLYINTIQGTEFSLLCRIWDAEEYIPQIINIPLNEYIFGSFEYNTVNIHYYTIFIPNSTDVIIELQGNNIEVYAKKGITKINIKKSSDETKKLTEELYDIEKLTISLNDPDLLINDYENNYISFAFVKESDIIAYSYYYFRIHQQNTNKDYLIYHLDTNKANICRPSKFGGKNICYFLLKNDYNDLSTNYTIYGYSKEEANYQLWELDQNDFYSIDIEEIKDTKSPRDLSEGNIFTSKNPLLIEISSDGGSVIKVLCDYAGQLKIPSLNIYSSQLFYFYTNETKNFSFNYRLLNEYNIIINTIKGKGNMYFYQKNSNITSENDITITENNYHSFIVSESSQNENIYFITDNYLFFRIKIDYRIDKDIEKISFGPNEKTNIEYGQFPVIYYIKDISNEGIEINFKLNYNGKMNNDYEFVCYGMIVDYQKIKHMNINRQYIDAFPEATKYGQYDVFTKSGVMIFDKEFINSNINYYGDNYFLFIINNDNYYPYISPDIFLSFSIEIFVDSKDSEINHHNIIPKNKYIRGSFTKEELNNNTQQQIYYIDKKNNNNEDKEYVLEFGYNSHDIELIFNYIDIKKNLTDKKIGFDKYIISLSNNSDYYSFLTVQKKNDTNNNKEQLKSFNYILRIYDFEEKNDNDENNILDKDFTFESKQLTIFNKNNKLKNPSSNAHYIYYVNVYQKDSLTNNEILNTIAIIEEDNIKTNNKSNIVGPNDEVSFFLNNLEQNKQYIATFFILVKNNNKENYYSLSYEFDTNIKGMFFTFIIISISVAIIVLIIVSIIIYKMCKKNKSLISKIQSISFAQGIDDTETDERKSKTEEDYDNTFI